MACANVTLVSVPCPCCEGTGRIKGTVLGYNVRRLRMERGWTQHETSARAGVCRSVINHLEGNNCGTRLATATKLARAFGVEVCELTAPPPPG